MVCVIAGVVPFLIRTVKPATAVIDGAAQQDSSDKLVKTDA